MHDHIYHSNSLVNLIVCCATPAWILGDNIEDKETARLETSKQRLIHSSHIFFPHIPVMNSNEKQ